VSQQFASDNNAGICPSALAAMLEANTAGHTPGYGDDPWTAKAIVHIQNLFETKASVHFVFNGTAANSLALAQFCRPYNSVIAHAFSHVEMDEAGGPGFYSGGAKLATLEGTGAKLNPTSVAHQATRDTGIHHSKPSVLSLSQATELGTVYTIDELHALTSQAHQHALKVHMDGARFANAVASLGCSPAEMSWKAGVDVLCFGGVKNGLGAGEAVLFFDPEDSREFEWRVKQSGHLNSKMRLVTSAWSGLLENGTWLKNAQHANAMADRLGRAMAGISRIKLTQPVEANAVFAEIPLSAQATLRQKGWAFYTFRPPLECRLMCAWDTEAKTVDRFSQDLAGIIAAHYPA